MNIAKDDSYTSTGELRGSIPFTQLKQLWIHTGTNCNLACPSCFEKSHPQDQRIQAITFNEVMPILHEAKKLGAQSFGFTGGEPFVNPEFMKILEHALSLLPCLVLSNGTKPLQNTIHRINTLAKDIKNALTIRVSIDDIDEKKHDEERGKGSFAMAIKSLQELKNVNISVARRKEKDEKEQSVTDQFKNLFKKNNLSEDIPIVAFPDLQAKEDTPEISVHCIQKYHTKESCASFMCAYSRMLIKKNNSLMFYACTLVDDDPFYALGKDLSETVTQPTILRHKRCFICFSNGVSCGG